MSQFKTLHFPSTPSGQKKKNKVLMVESSLGWRLVSETLESGKYNMNNACCTFLLCGPIGAFMGGYSKGTINVTLQKESETSINRDELENALGKFSNFELIQRKQDDPENKMLYDEFQNKRTSRIQNKIDHTTTANIISWILSFLFIIALPSSYHSQHLTSGDTDVVKFLFIIIGILLCPWLDRIYEYLVGLPLKKPAKWTVIAMVAFFIYLMNSPDHLFSHHKVNPGGSAFADGRRASNSLLGGAAPPITAEQPTPYNLQWDSSREDAKKILIENNYQLIESSNGTAPTNTVTDDFRGAFLNLPTENLYAVFSQDKLSEIIVHLKSKKSYGKEGISFGAVEKLIKINLGKPIKSSDGKLSSWELPNDTCILITEAKKEKGAELFLIFIQNSQIKKILNMNCAQN